MVNVVSTRMIDAGLILQLLNNHPKKKDVTTEVRFTPSCAQQRPLLDWFGKNWRLLTHLRMGEGMVGDRLDTSRFLAQHAKSPVKVDKMSEDGLAAVSFTDLASGLDSGTETNIITGRNMYKAVQVGMKAADCYTVDGLALPLVRLSHRRSREFWVAMPNQSLDRASEFDLFQLALYAMSSKRKIYDAADRWAHVEVPQVDAIVHHKLDWMSGLKLNNATIEQVLQVCRLEIGLDRYAKIYGKVGGPQITSETLTGLPPMCFNRDLVVWVSHKDGKVVSPVIHVPTSMWTKA